MKKLCLSLAICGLTLVTACKKEEPAPAPIIIETPAAEATPAPPAPENSAEPSTSVTLNKDGIDVKSEKTKVKVDEKGASVEVK